MPTNTNAQAYTWNTVLLILILVACFPGLPQYLLLSPLRLLPSWTSTSKLPAITCPPGCSPNTPDMAWFQKTFTLQSKSRGSYLVTDEVLKNLPEIKDYKVGLLNLFVQHTSCALSLNENWDSDVREDMSDALDRIAPEDRKGNLYRHSAEGLDDMPVSPEQYLRNDVALTSPGAYQVSLGWCQRECPHLEWQAQHWHMARHLVSGVPGFEAYQKSGCNDTRREGLR